MTRPSKVGEILLIAFGAAFAAGGIFLAAELVFPAPGQIQGNRWAGLVVCTTLILVGGGIIFAVIYGTRKVRQQMAAEQSNPESPWLWREDWAARRAESKNRNSATGLWIAAILVNTIAFTVAAWTVPFFWPNSDPKIFFPLAFCMAGVFLAVLAIRAGLRRKRFGQTYFEFASLPFCPGQSLKGAIHVRFKTEAKHGINLRLSCVRRVVTGTGEDRSTRVSVLWQAEKNVAQGMLTPGPMGDATIPVDFGIPSDAYETFQDQLDDKVLWLLHARADVPGVDYVDEFEVPVFRLTQSPASESATFFSDQAASAVPAFAFDASEVAAPPNPKVVVSKGMNGGTEFYFRPFRNPGGVLFLLAFTAAWTAIVYFIGRSHAPRFFAVVFGFFDLFLIYALIRAALAASRIEVGNGKIVFRRTLLGIGAAREIPFPEIAQIVTVTIPQQRGSPGSYSLRLYTREGRKLTLADAIADRQEARWVACQLQKLSGLQLDTHVAVETGFGVNGPPPQRGRPSSVSAVALRRTSPAGTAVAVLFFFASMGFFGYQVFVRGHGRSKRVPKFSATAGSSLRRPAYPPLTDRDVQRLQILPDQAQAEELLARAIQRDPRALALFEQNIGVWHNIQRTSAMNELEERSRFSTDLRVRYANADLNLAMDGLPKTVHSADELIARAKAEPAHRPYSVYHLGMLAGRGVAYDRIYPILVDYARHDADPQVRQSAVEGMRYLGTDEALGELFACFAHDSSYAVRDRAGCNVSICGNFMRKQRMRMVPSLIELAGNPQSTPQMRNWTFLALREITDQSLPADESAWRNWYAQHGAEKMAQFQRLDWWRVRGAQPQKPWEMPH